ncbi:hypothetical protein AVEN_11937-1 [Araneus ventricosus]|uniref:Uncharacterized protein n=1 Tax=Araneus ventricosus TaxID=182803 RepID=A0A4Y2EVF1_ARAVE|nr:hypothetical protein AVEN_11937-1 [Araneus ventricosus]
MLMVFLRYSLWRRHYSQLMPGKRLWFFNIFGDLIEIWTAKSVPLGIMELLRKRAELFQKEKIFCIWAAYIPFVFFVRADVVKVCIPFYDSTENQQLSNAHEKTKYSNFE